MVLRFSRSLLLTLAALLSLQGARASVSAETPFQAEGRSCREVLATWSARSGVRLEAAPELVEEKVTLRLSQPSTPRFQAALAAALDAVWISPASPELPWRLRPTKERQRRLEEARRLRAEALRALA
ncbi:MAG TPA: hypothetical protein VFU47_11930, partial [Armatimonadota bacterium]|nr:hypothetical protein [Armatimonadota bacterium]